MSTPQSAIIPDHCRAAIYIEADVNAGNESALRLSCHKALDVLAAMQKAFPDREIVGIDCNALIKQHGSLHCVTMQFPKS